MKRQTCLALAVTAAFMAPGALAAAAGGFVGAGVGITPDYEGSNDYEAVPALFGRYTWESGRYVALSGTTGAGQAARIKANLFRSG